MMQSSQTPDDRWDEDPGLLIGAYERDNFGDILFLNRTRDYLDGRPAVACAPSTGDTTDVGGEAVRSYARPLAAEPVPFVWVVGGETGNTSVSQARSMTGEHVLRVPSGDRIPEFASPYLPRPSRYSATQSARYVINSVGLSGAGLLTGRRRIETQAALRESTFLSVRDRPSSRILSRLGIPHRLAPDLVHTLALVEPQPAPDERDIALVQLKKQYIDATGVQELAKYLASSSELRRFRIRLFSAGEAPGHDSRPLLESVAEEMLRRGAGTGRVEVSLSRTAAEKAAEIASAGLWIGTSLHGLIISTSFSVPRVGLLLRKVGIYARSWEIPGPVQVGIQDLDQAISQAMSVSTAVHHAVAQRLSAAAHVNVMAAVEHLADGRAIEVRSSDAARVDRALRRSNALSEWAEASTLLAVRGARAAGRRLARKP